MKKERSPSGFFGNIGLFHSRINSKGDSKWAQPFVVPEKSLAVVAQGSNGIFLDEAPKIEMGNKILDSGKKIYQFSKSLWALS